jgi:hypothetical protein
MPKRLKQLKKLSQGEREKAVIDAVGTIGYASISDVTKAVSERFSIDLEAKNAFEAFKKSIRLDLQKLAGQSLGIAYFSKDLDGPEKIHEDDLQYDKNGKVKNIYNIKYFKLSNGSSVPGGDIFANFGGLFMPQYNSVGDLTVDWSIGKFDTNQAIKKNYIRILFIESFMNHVCLDVPFSDCPFKLLIGRGTRDDEEILDRELIKKAHGNRCAAVLVPDSSISRPKEENDFGHILLSVLTDGSILAQDLGSTNGSSFMEITNDYMKTTLEIVLKKSTLPESIIDKKWVPLAKVKSSLPSGFKIGNTKVIIFKE